MSVSGYDDLMRHYGHDVKVVRYGTAAMDDWWNVAIECVTCSEVLVDFDAQ